MAKAQTNSNSDQSMFDESGQLRSTKTTEAVRSKLNDDIEAFLAGGGKIDQVERNGRGDPIKKPKSNYGSRPI